jgi:hypothetical protein
MKVQFNIADITRDRRTKSQLESARAINQERADQAIEKLWRARVEANVLARLDRRVEEFLRS